MEDFKYITEPNAEYPNLAGERQLPLFSYERGRKTTASDKRMLSLFSGCGGMDLGFEGGFSCHRASVGNDKWIDYNINDNWVVLKANQFRTIFANDILKEARTAWLNYMQRFEVSPDIYHTDSIVDLVKSHQKGVKVFPDDVDIVTGGFPCQDFSIAGKRKGFDSRMNHDGRQRQAEAPSEETRGKLYFWMKQVIDITKPKMFIAENVKGLVSLGDVKRIIQEDFASADDDGYIVLDPQILHAGDYGVPETRERVIFIGIRKSALKEKALKELSKDCVPDEYNPYPMATHHYTPTSKGKLKPVSCRMVLGELREPENSLDLSQKFFSKAKFMGNHCQGQTEINLDGLGPTIRSEHHGNIEFRRLSAEHGGKITEELQKGLAERRLTPRECAMIQTFPPDYPFVKMKNYTKHFELNASGAYKVIGNAVPPILAYNIARRIQSLWSSYFK